MKSQIGAIAATLAVLAWSTPAHAQKAACSLLTTAEVSTAIGTKAPSGTDHSFVVDSGPSKGETMRTCTWMLGPFRAVTLNFLHQSTGAQREQGLSAVREQLNDLKEKGWDEQFDDTPDPKCATLTPPKGMADAPTVVACMTEQKGNAIGVGFMNVGGSVPTGNMRTLLSQAVARLP